MPAPDRLRIGVVASMKRGLEHFVHQELMAFERMGHRVVLLPTKMGPGLYAPRAAWEVHAWTPAGVALALLARLGSNPRRFVRLLMEAGRYGVLAEFALACWYAKKAKHLDVIYATFGDRKLYLGYFLKQWTGRPLAVKIHAYELYENPAPALFVRALGLCDRIMTVTDYNRDYLATRFGVPRDHVEVVRIAVDTEDYRPADTFVVLIVAFFVERKGHRVLFEALRQLEGQGIEAWVVGGEGTERPVDVPALARRLGVDDRVAFFGKLSGSALKAVYRRCDVFCLPCHTDSHGVKEGFPTALAEAMAFGKPVITTRHVEIPRVIEHVLVDENDPEGLAAAILRLREDAALRRKLGTINRGRAEELFSLRNTFAVANVLGSLVGPDRDLDSAGASLPRHAPQVDGG